MLLTLGCFLFACPLGIAAGIYIAEYAKDSAATRAIRIAIISLAGVPSVVYGLFGLGMFVVFFQMGVSILAASMTLAIMTLPVVISTTEEALRSVPNAFRVVSISLGATRWQTVWRIILKEGMPGILTGVILGLERAAVETAPILFTGAAFYLPTLPTSPLDPTMALPYHIYVISTQVPGMPITIQYATVLVLLSFVLVMNLIATFIRSACAGQAAVVNPMDIIRIEDFSITYADGSESLRGINLGIKEHAINVLFGPAGGGKSTLLRAINRLNDLTDVKENKGRILFQGGEHSRPQIGCHPAAAKDRDRFFPSDAFASDRFPEYHLRAGGGRGT